MNRVSEWKWIGGQQKTFCKEKQHYKNTYTQAQKSGRAQKRGLKWFSSQLQMNVINNESNFVVNQHKIMQRKAKHKFKRALAEWISLLVTSVTCLWVCLACEIKLFPRNADAPTGKHSFNLNTQNKANCKLQPGQCLVACVPV